MSADVESLLRQARELAGEGRRDEALVLHLKYHQESRPVPTQAGARLSFALTSWVALARDHPPALAALLEVREAAAERLRAGRSETVDRVSGASAAHEDFAEVAAISSRLGDDEYPVALFAELAQGRPEVAEATAIAARRLLIQAGCFDLAHRYLADPEERVTRLAARLEQRLTRGFGQFPESQRERMRGDTVRRYLDDVRELVTVYRAVGQPERAEAIAQQAIDAVPWAHVREDIAHELALTTN